MSDPAAHRMTHARAIGGATLGERRQLVRDCIGASKPDQQIALLLAGVAMLDSETRDAFVAALTE